MRKNHIRHCLIIVCLSLFTALQAQDYPKTTIGGKEFYKYKIEKSEGLFAISRKFGVTQEELIRYNPSLKDGAKLDQEIFVPVVKSKEPEIVAVPVFHTVEEKETLYGISKQYNITVNELLAANPELNDRMIRKGDELRIPNQTQKTMATSPKVQETPKPQEEPKKEPVIVADTLKIKQPGGVVKVAFLLPFMVSAAKAEPAVDKFFDFYQGALLAIDSLKKQGVSVTVYTYDTDRNVEKVNQLLQNPELKTVDFIFGPAYTNLVKPIADFAKKNKIRLVVPFSAKTPETATNEYIYQPNAQKEVFDERVIRLFSNAFNTDDKNIVLLKFYGNAQNADKNFADSLAKTLTKNNIKYTLRSLTPDSIPLFSLDKYWVAGKENVILPATTSSVTLLRLMAALNSSEKEFSLFGFPEWLQMTKNQEEVFVHQTYIPTPFYLDYDNPSVKRFFKRYLDNFGDEGSSILPYYSLLGYDIAFYFIDGLYKYGGNFETHLTDYHPETLQTSFLFEKVGSEGGYMNMNVFLVKYKDKEVVRIK